MKNPWTKKNPWMSIWLSSANRAAGSARSRATAQGKRQAADLMTQSMRQVTDFWTGMLLPPAPRKKKKTR